VAHNAIKGRRDGAVQLRELWQVFLEDCSHRLCGRIPSGKLAQFIDYAASRPARNPGPMMQARLNPLGPGEPKPQLPI
jgi:hypothetical protein